MVGTACRAYIPGILPAVHRSSAFPLLHAEGKSRAPKDWAGTSFGLAAFQPRAEDIRRHSAAFRRTGGSVPRFLVPGTKAGLLKTGSRRMSKAPLSAAGVKFLVESIIPAAGMESLLLLGTNTKDALKGPWGMGKEGEMVGLQVLGKGKKDGLKDLKAVVKGMGQVHYEAGTMGPLPPAVDKRKDLFVVDKEDRRKD